MRIYCVHNRYFFGTYVYFSIIGELCTDYTRNTYRFCTKMMQAFALQSRAHFHTKIRYIFLIGYYTIRNQFRNQTMRKQLIQQIKYEKFINIILIDHLFTQYKIYDENKLFWNAVQIFSIGNENKHIFFLPKPIPFKFIELQ